MYQTNSNTYSGNSSQEASYSVGNAYFKKVSGGGGACKGTCRAVGVCTCR